MNNIIRNRLSNSLIMLAMVSIFWAGEAPAQLLLDYSDDRYKFFGKIDEQSAAKFIRSPAATLSIVSTGGHAGAAETMAKHIQSSGIKVELPFVCASACAEYIASSADVLSVGDRTIIAYHHNHYVIDRAFRMSEGFDEKREPHNCSRVFKERQSEIYLKGGLRPDFWVMQAKALGLERSKIVDEIEGGECAAVQVSLRNSFWLPSSGQLKKYLGLELDSDICNDNMDCLGRYWPAFARVGQRIVVGSDVYMIDNKGVLVDVGETIIFD